MKMTILKTVIAVIVWLIGLGIIDKNANGEPFKHNVLMGSIGWVFAVIIPFLLIGPMLL